MTLRHRIRLAGATAVAVALLTTGCGSNAEEEEAAGTGDAESTETRSISVSAPPSYNALTLHVAEAEGYFEEVGLDVELSSSVGAETVPQLLGGNLQFVLNDMTTLVRGASEGVPLAIAAPNVLLDPPADEAYAKVLIRAEDADKFDSAADMVDGTIGIPTINSEPWLEVRTLVEEAGGDPEALEFVEVPNPLQALSQKQVDFVTAPDPMATMGVLSGDYAELAPVVLKDPGGVIGYPYVTTTELAQSDPELVVDFRSAVIKANKLINSDRERALEVAATYLDVPEEALQESVVPSLGEEMPTTEDVQKHIDRIVGSGIIPEEKAPDAADLLTQ